MMKSAVYANYSPKEKSERTHVYYSPNRYNVTNANTGLIWSIVQKKRVIRIFYATTARVIST
jgi:hypothetical protein